MRIGSGYINWVSLKSDGSNYIKSDIPTNEISVNDLLSVSLTKNIGIFLYQTGVKYYRHEDNNKVVIFNDMVYDSGDVSLTGTKSIKVSLNCFCNAINKLMCFGSTLNCVIINKAASIC